MELGRTTGLLSPSYLLGRSTPVLHSRAPESQPSSIWGPTICPTLNKQTYLPVSLFLLRTIWSHIINKGFLYAVLLVRITNPYGVNTHRYGVILQCTKHYGVNSNLPIPTGSMYQSIRRQYKSLRDHHNIIKAQLLYQSPRRLLQLSTSFLRLLQDEPKGLTTSSKSRMGHG